MSYNNETLKLSEAVKQLQEQINALKADLETYNQSPKFNKRFAFYKSQQIKVLENVAESINDFKTETDLIFTEAEKQAAIKEDKILKLEGICLIHGISDLTTYLNYPVKDIVETVKDAYANKWRQTPLQLMPGYKLIEEIKTAPTPIYNFSSLLQGAENNKNNDLKLN